MRVLLTICCLISAVFNGQTLQGQEKNDTYLGINANWGIGPHPAKFVPQPEREPGTFSGLRIIRLNTASKMSYALSWQRGTWTIGDNNENLGFHQYTLEASKFFLNRSEIPFVSLGIHMTCTDGYRNGPNTQRRHQIAYGVNAGVGMDVEFQRRWALSLRPFIMNWGWQKRELKMQYWYGTIGLTWYLFVL